MRNSIKTLLITAVSSLAIAGTASAGTIEGSVMADNEFIVVLKNGTGSTANTTVFAMNDGQRWKRKGNFSFDVNGTREQLRNCSVNIIAWGDGSYKQGMVGILKGDAGTLYTGSGMFRSGQSNISAPNPTGTNGPSSTQINTMVNMPLANNPPQTFNGTVTGGTNPWGSHAFPSNLMTGVNAANFKWVWPSTSSSAVSRRVYSVFRAPCGQLVRPKSPPPPPPPIPNGDHFQCYMLEKGDRVKRETIYIKDQFGGTKAVLGKPVMLCNPSQKIHNGKEYPVRNEKRHLVCYDYVEQEKPRNQNLHINTQFGDDKVISTRRSLFCAPAGKAHIKKARPGRPYIQDTKPIPRKRR